MGRKNINIFGSFMEPFNCAVYVVSLRYTHTQYKAHISNRRAILCSCSNVNNDEKFRAQSLQQLQYRGRFY